MIEKITQCTNPHTPSLPPSISTCKEESNVGRGNSTLEKDAKSMPNTGSVITWLDKRPIGPRVTPVLCDHLQSEEKTTRPDKTTQCFTQRQNHLPKTISFISEPSAKDGYADKAVKVARNKWMCSVTSEKSSSTKNDNGTSINKKELTAEGCKMQPIALSPTKKIGNEEESSVSQSTPSTVSLREISRNDSDIKDMVKFYEQRLQIERKKLEAQLCLNKQLREELDKEKEAKDAMIFRTKEENKQLRTKLSVEKFLQSQLLAQIEKLKEEMLQEKTVGERSGGHRWNMCMLNSTLKWMVEKGDLVLEKSTYKLTSAIWAMTLHEAATCDRGNSIGSASGGGTLATCRGAILAYLITTPRQCASAPTIAKYLGATKERKHQKKVKEGNLVKEKSTYKLLPEVASLSEATVGVAGDDSGVDHSGNNGDDKYGTGQGTTCFAERHFTTACWKDILYAYTTHPGSMFTPSQL